MPSALTKADSIRVYLSGAPSDGGAQTDPNLSLGKFRSSTLSTFLGQTITNPITNITVNFVAGANGVGAGTITATGNDTLAWTPPGGSQGANVTILNGETKILEGGGGATGKYVRVTRNDAVAMTGTATVTLADQFNNLIGFDNVTSAEATAGDTEYRALFFKNEAASEVKNLKVYLGQLGTPRVSGTTQLGATGAGTIAIAAGDFNDWPASGCCRIEDNAGALKEMVYYSSRAATALAIPAGGRGLMGTSGVAGVATDNVYAVPSIRLAGEAPASQPSGAITDQTVAGENAQPAGMTWITGILPATGIQVGNLAATNIYGIWIERVVVAGAISEAAVLNKLLWQFDAA